MRLAEKIGFYAPSCAVIYFDEIPYYCVTRYDRQEVSGKFSRLHQEDFCQLFSVDPGKSIKMMVVRQIMNVSI